MSIKKHSKDEVDLVESSPTGFERLLRSRRTQYNIAPVLLFIAALSLFFLQNDRSFHGLFTVFPASLVKHATTTCLLAIGASLVIATSQIDLSAIGVATLSGLLFAVTLSYFPHPGILPALLSILVAIIFATLSGLLVAICYIRLRVPLLIFTWALGSIYVVFALFLAAAAKDTFPHDVSGVAMPAEKPSDFFDFGHLGFYLSVAAMILAFILAHWTNLHQRAAAIGANSLSAEYAGVPKRRTYIECFLMNAWLAAIAGIHHSLFLSQATTRDLYGRELTPIAVALLGGTSLSGGYLRLSSVLAAAFFWATVQLLGPRLPEFFSPLNSIQAELGQILFYAIFIAISLIFGRLLAPRIPKVFARQEE